MKTPTSIRELGWLDRTGAKVCSLAGYPRYRRECLRGVVPVRGEASTAQTQEELNQRMSGYPRNHVYRIVHGRIVPGFRLYERLRIVTRIYPDPIHSFLDIGCCRGFYVLDAALRLGCPRAVGIDVHEPFITTARDAAQYLRVPGAAFHYASLEDVSGTPQEFGGPFQVVMLIGTYHYLYWGSSLCSTAYHSHEEILRRLASICTHQLIISARFTMDRLPRDIQTTRPEGHGNETYTVEAFLQSAEKFFHTHHAGYLGVYPLFVMTKRT
ncbi:MAG: class I SAM-dependent methyltransferase [Planctomycetes bacterium]|nr:class I SAM-dependent methyltransferase [Planctomycetota bacterium]